MKSIWNRIKRSLARVLPAPMRCFKRENQMLRALLAEQTAQTKALNERLDRQAEAIRALSRQVENMRATIVGSKKELSSQLYEFLDPKLYEHVLRQWYQKRTGDPLDLDNPRTYNEKIQWMKIYDNDPRKIVLADKLLVRDWVKGKIGEEYLIPLLAVYNKAAEIDFDALPDQFVLKANHGCGYNAIVQDKNEENLEALREKATGWLQENYAYCFGLELQYSGIPRRLLVEKYLENADGDMPDYKLWCFDGKVKFIQIIEGRKVQPHMALFDTHWNRLPFSTGAYPPITEEVKMPDVIPEMIRIAECLSEGFAHVRVDLYALDNGEIKFGEMTFTTSSGVTNWDPPEADLLVGEMLHLPEHRDIKT